MTKAHGRLRAASMQQASASTRERIIVAAVETLREEGFAGTSARAIARHGDFNQALIFYHFGGVLDLLVSVLETMSAERLAQYREATADAPDLRSLLATAHRQYANDVREGHITVLVELIAGASSAPQLGPEIVRCTEPWIAFVEESFARYLGATPLADIVPARDGARALLAIYLGMELLDHLDPQGDTAGRLFILAERILAAVEPFLGVRRALGSEPSRRLQRIPIDVAPPKPSRDGARGRSPRRSAR